VSKWFGFKVRFRKLGEIDFKKELAVFRDLLWSNFRKYVD
jgi:hypothetical protein